MVHLERNSPWKCQQFSVQSNRCGRWWHGRSWTEVIPSKNPTKIKVKYDIKISKAQHHIRSLWQSAISLIISHFRKGCVSILDGSSWISFSEITKLSWWPGTAGGESRIGIAGGVQATTSLRHVGLSLDKGDIDCRLQRFRFWSVRLRLHLVVINLSSKDPLD